MFIQAQGFKLCHSTDDEKRAWLSEVLAGKNPHVELKAEIDATAERVKKQRASWPEGGYN